jgi:hypothetical protein
MRRGLFDGRRFLVHMVLGVVGASSRIIRRISSRPAFLRVALGARRPLCRDVGALNILQNQPVVAGRISYLAKGDDVPALALGAPR